MPWRSGLASSDRAVGLIRTRVAEDLSPRDHALLEFFWESVQRRRIYSQSPQTVPGEAQSHPPPVFGHRGASYGGRLHRRQDTREPSPSGRAIAKGQKLILCRERRCPGEQDVLNVVEFQHVAMPP